MKPSELFQGHYLNLPNLLTVTRVLFLPPFVYLSDLYSHDPKRIDFLMTILGIILLVTLTDFLDGFLARRWNQVTPLGQYLDPLCDKIVTVSSLVVLTAYFSYPVWMLLYYVFRELLGFFGGAYIYLKMGVQGKPNLWGKLGVGIVSISVIWYIFQPWLRVTLPVEHPLLHPELSVYSLAFVLTGGILSYSWTYLPMIFSAKRNDPPRYT